MVYRGVLQGLPYQNFGVAACTMLAIANITGWDCRATFKIDMGFYIGCPVRFPEVLTAAPVAIIVKWLWDESRNSASDSNTGPS